MKFYTIIRMTPLLILSILASVSFSVAQAQDVPFYDGDPNFLFVGNSYTGQNNLPNTFKSILVDAFPEWTDNNQVDSVNPGGRTFSAHYAGIETEADGASRRLKGFLVTDPKAYKWVTLQEQSQTGGFSQWDWEGTGYYDSLVGARGLNELIAATGGQTVFYMTWGRRDGDAGNDFVFPDFLTMQDRLVEGYMRYVEETSTPERPTFVAPVGLVFRTIHNDLVAQDIVPTDSGTLFHSLYRGDGSHPTASGTYVAALTIFTTMFGIDPESINWFGSIDEETARILQNAVSRTVLENFESGFITFPWTQAWTGTVSVDAAGTVAPTTIPTGPPTPLPATPQPTVSTPPPTVTTTAPTVSTPPPTVSTPPPTVTTPPPTMTTPQPTATAPPPTVSPPQPTASTPSAIVTSAVVSTPQPTATTPQPTTLTLSPIASTPQPTVNTPAPAGSIPQPTASTPVSTPTASTPPPTSISATNAPSVGSTPTPDKTSATTRGSITIEILYDNYPQDIAWTFLQQGASEPLYFQPYGAVETPGILQTETFSDLNPDSTYRFLISDQVGDGLCCAHGIGYVKLTDNQNLGRSTILYDLGETLGGYYELEITMGSSGEATVASTSQEYVPSTWPDLETLLWAPKSTTAEPEWPGKYPNNDASTVVVNIDLHDNPQDISWSLYEMTADQNLLSDSDPSNDWILDTTWNGSLSVAGSLNSTEVPFLQQGWYRFVVASSTKNGLCCNPNATHNGYVTLMGPLAATGGAKGLIWGTNGEFGEQATIQFRMDETGRVSHVQWEANPRARAQVAPSSAPAVVTSPTISPPPTAAAAQTDSERVDTLPPQEATVSPTANVVSPTGLPGLSAITSSAPRLPWLVGSLLVGLICSYLA